MAKSRSLTSLNLRAATGANSTFSFSVMSTLIKEPASSSNAVSLAMSKPIILNSTPAPKEGRAFSLIKTPFSKNCFVSVGRLK